MQTKENTYPGESPINIKPADTTETSEAFVNLTGFNHTRIGMSLSNNGHTVKLSICGNGVRPSYLSQPRIPNSRP